MFQDTEWASMYHAYDSLPEAMKARLEGIRAIHVFDQDLNPRLPPSDTRFRDKHSKELRQRTPPVVHPLVRTHPATGRKSLYVNPTHVIRIAGMPEAEGDGLLAELYWYMLQPNAEYRHKWRAGDVVIWDNRCTVHSAAGGYPSNERRIHWRTTVMQ